MTAKGITPYVVAGLVLIGCACVGLRYHARRDARLGLADTVWRLTYSIECEADEPGATLRVAVPQGTPYGRIFRRDVRDSGMRVDFRCGAAAGTPQAGARIVTADDVYELETTFSITRLPGIPSGANSRRNRPNLQSRLQPEGRPHAPSP